MGESLTPPIVEPPGAEKKFTVENALDNIAWGFNSSYFDRQKVLQSINKRRAGKEPIENAAVVEKLIKEKDLDVLTQIYWSLRGVFFRGSKGNVRQRNKRHEGVGEEEV